MDISNLRIEDTIRYVLQADPETGVVQKINGDTPENLVVSGFTINGPFMYNVGNIVNGYVLTVDDNGVASWQPSMASGTSGNSGTSGIDGSIGTAGTSGLSYGTSGVDGTMGTSGISYGTSGSSGIGSPGADGTSGMDGEAGTSGVDGAIGTAGTSGLSYGSSGTSGLTGTSGSTGSSGSSGKNGDLYRTTSTSTYTLGETTGTTLTVETGLGYSIAQAILIVHDENNYQEAKVLSYDKNTGDLVFDNVSSVTGSGTYSSWIVNLSGAAGGDGSSGSSGSVGAPGSSGTSGASGSSGTSSPGITSGSAGSSGINGPSGPRGTGGTSGTAATAGTSGGPGSSGSAGSSGVSGAMGSSGSSGAAGTAGTAGLNGTSGTSFTGAQNYVQVLGSQVNGVTSAVTSIISGSITTKGGPVYIQITGDANPTGAGAQWCKLQIYRGATPIGNIIQAEQTASNINIPYCVNFIDSVAAGTYSYSMRVVGISGTFQFGEVNGPTLTLVEMTGGNSTSGANGSSGSSGAGSFGSSGSSGFAGTSGTSALGSSGSSGVSGGYLKMTQLLDNVIANSTTLSGQAIVSAWTTTYTSQTGTTCKFDLSFTAWATSVGAKQFDVLIDNVVKESTTFYFNNTNVHHTIPTSFNVEQLSAGSHTIQIRIPAGVTVDAYDYANLSVIESMQNALSGSNGTSGQSGTHGVSGTAGSSGLGSSGTSGLSGTHGVSGTSGNGGSSGSSGSDTSVLTVSTKTSNYTLALVDKGNLVEINSASNLTVTVPPNSTVAFPVGSQVLLVRGSSGGAVSVVAGSGVTIKSANNYLNLNYANSGATLVKVATDTWYLFGDIKA